MRRKFFKIIIVLLIILSSMIIGIYLQRKLITREIIRYFYPEYLIKKYHYTHNYSQPLPEAYKYIPNVSHLPNLQNIEEHKLYSESLKTKLEELLSLNKYKLYDVPQYKVKDVIETDRFIREKIIIETTPGTFLPAYLFHPKDISKKYPAVVAFHGHSYGMRGVTVDDTSYEKAYGRFLANNGYVVLALTNRTFIEADSIATQLHAIRQGLMKGKPVLGDFIYDGFRAVSLLSSLDYVEKTQIGVAGVSLGGMISLFVTALDERVKASVAAGILGQFSGVFSNTLDCSCVYIPGILNTAEMGDIAASIAPRAVLFINGEQDDFFHPAVAEKIIQKTIKPTYRLYGKENNIKLFRHPEGHVMVPDAALEWFNRHLKKGVE